YHSQIGTPSLAPVVSKFIGNTMEICPVGALTSATYRFRSRPWDNQRVQSICPHCGCGCAIELNVRGGEVTRARPREHPEVNDIWLCDKGFFGYEFAGSPERLTVPLVRRDGALREATWEEALDRVGAALRAAPADGIGVMGGARTTNEENFLLLHLFRGILGTNHIDFRTGTAHPQPTATAPWGLDVAIADVERAGAILLVGCDLTEEYPIIWLRVKKAIDRGARLIIMSPWDLEIARWGSHTFVHRAGTEASLLDALSGRLPPAAAAQRAGVSAEALEAASAALRGAARALVLVGQAALERPDGEAVLDAVDRLRGVLGGADLGVLRGRGNSGGAQLLGLLPDMLPGYRPLADADARAALEAAWDRPVPAAPGRAVRGMLDAARTGALQVLYVVGADPATEYPDAGAWAEARRRLGVLV
ncbi:MAG: NADH-quinone oxidoreductase subunit G, partial [Bacillati bacterium ANGP1]